MFLKGFRKSFVFLISHLTGLVYKHFPTTFFVYQIIVVFIGCYVIGLK